MRPLLEILAVLAACHLAVAGARASSSAEIETEGGVIRLVTSGLADAGGELRGALEIRLRPGWKTYWREPGSAGVPPSIGLGGSINVESAELGFPAPRWHDDGTAAWAGYDRPVALPVRLRVADPARYSLVAADIFLGVCETICVPVQARLEVEPGSAPDDVADARTVEAAFAALPPPPRPGFGVAAARLEGDRLVVEATLPSSAGRAELFLAPEAGYVFGIPGAEPRSAGGASFAVPVLERPAGGGAVEIHYTLSAAGEAVAGTMIVPAP